jgi:hypothetical protein
MKAHESLDPTLQWPAIAVSRVFDPYAGATPATICILL